MLLTLYCISGSLDTHGISYLRSTLVDTRDNVEAGRVRICTSGGFDRGRYGDQRMSHI